VRALRARWDALDTLAIIRAGLLLLAAGAGLVTAIELAFLGHWDGTLQLLPWVALAAVVVALVLVAARPRRWLVRTGQACAATALAMGVIGVAIHVIENHEAGVLDFRYADTWPTMGELGRWWLAATGAVGATPPLAPASLSFAAVLVLLASVRLGTRDERVTVPTPAGIRLDEAPSDM
jgi:hypothetical protein